MEQRNFFEQYVSDVFECMTRENFVYKDGKSAEYYNLTNEQVALIAKSFQIDRHVSDLFNQLDEICREYIVKELQKIGIEEVSK